MSTASLERLIERAKKYRMTPEERDAQVRSFAYGNTHMENESITMDDIQDAMTSLKADRGTSRT